MRIVFENIEIRVVNQRLTHGKVLQERDFLDKLKKMIINISSKKNKTKRLLATLLMAAFIFVQNPLTLALAQSAPEAPSAPSAPAAPTPPVELEEPAAPSEPTPPPSPEAPSAPTLEEATNPEPTPTWPNHNRKEDESDSGSGSNSDSSNGGAESNSSTYPDWNEGTGGQSSDGQSGSTTINTGDADNVGNISTKANTNISLTPSSDTTSAGVAVTNSGNGTDSVNTGSVATSTDTNNFQNNSANVGNNLFQNTTTGDNSASRNTGGDQKIVTGDANTTGTIITGVNTNIDALAVYEFNVTDDHQGDYILDLSKATCIQGCAGGDTTVKNTGNGADSTNTGNLDSSVTDNSFQTNDALIENNMTLISDSGDNKVDMNTGGDSSVTTGDANVSGSVVNMVNNNFAGDVVYAVVNIFGNFVGDIILPDGTVLSCCASSTTAANVGNGTGSENTASVDQTTNTNTYQFNAADIQNNLILDAETGDNDVNKNTDGSSSVTTGDSNVVAQVLNVANTNIIGGTWWLVLVNEAGKWIGKIVGSPDGQNYAGSDGFEFTVNETGEITAVNSGNGAGSTNDASVNQNTNTTTSQTNNATIVNNVNLSAKTGDNSANMNTGGNNSIVTGDATIVASIVNFVNNNIVGGGKLFVTVVNVFGSWLGDFVGPGQTKESDNQPGIGGSSTPENNTNTNTNGESNATGTDSSSHQTSVASYIIETQKKILKVSGNSGSGISGVNEADDELAIVAGNSSIGEDATLGKKVIKVNLAWFIFALPLGLGYYIIRRKRIRAAHAA